MFFRVCASLLALLSVTNALAMQSRNPYQSSYGHRQNSCNSSCIDAGLTPLLSSQASIVHSSNPRWSSFKAPQPGSVVNVATENDVVQTVQFCTKNNVPFVAQGGGHGWAITFNLGGSGIVINLRKLNSVQFNAGSNPSLTFGGGSLISEVLAAADQNGCRVATGNCNCVGTIGAIMGGGLGHFQGLYGLGVDNVLAVNIVTADGKLRTVSASQDPDLWWAIRGAGPNFGVVTSVTTKAHPLTDRSVWAGTLSFDPSKIEAIVSTINILTLEKPMSIFLYYVTSGAPSYTPTVLVAPFYAGSAIDGRAAFKPIFDIGYLSDSTTELPYTSANIMNDPLCNKDYRRPSFGQGLGQMVPATWRAIWNEYVSYVQNTARANSAIFVECYSQKTALEYPDDSSSYAFRSTIKHIALVNNQYTDPSLDGEAVAFGLRVRDLWRGTDGLAARSTYVNFAYGDESLQSIYGGNVQRLQALKATYDPHGWFNQWFPLTSSTRS